jgi:membrane peptidoglycan carboxypeptidase
VTRSWSRDEFVNTLAARGDFGSGWRGIARASRRYFDRDPEALSLAQAALLASRLGDSQPNPWCEPDAAALARNRVLSRMRDIGAISDADFEIATVAPLALGPLPDGRACAE